MVRIALCVALICALPVLGAPLSKSEANRLKQEIAKAASGQNWRQVGELLVKLAEADTSKTAKFLVKVAEKAPPNSGVAARLADAAEKMSSKGAQKELRKAGLKSKSEAVRRSIASYLAGEQDWDGLMDMLGDSAASVVALAAGRLVDGAGEDAVEPLLDAMSDLEKRDSSWATNETWDVFRVALGRLLKRRLGSSGAYRSWWLSVKSKGGLDSIEVETEGEGGTSVRLFGREIECTSVVFVLDISGSMESIDAVQADPLAGSGGTTVRGGGGSQGPRPNEPAGRTRLERAKIALNKVLETLPAHFKVNVITYSTGVRIWKRGEPSSLHALTDEARTEAMAWVESQKSRGVTETDDALREALNVDGVRCVYLLSDGFVTHDGTTEVPHDDVVKVVWDAMGDRHITIHTMGFEGAPKELMQRLAEKSGGKYSDIK